VKFFTLGLHVHAQKQGVTSPDAVTAGAERSKLWSVVAGMVEATTCSLKMKARDIGKRKVVAEERLKEIVLELDTMAGSPGLEPNLVDKEVRLELHICRTCEIQ
jgi:hypothetical protein